MEILVVAVSGDAVAMEAEVEVAAVVDIEVAGGGGRDGGGRDGDWRCPNLSCGNVNFARRVECNKCSTPAPSAGDKGGGGYSRSGGDSDRGGGYGGRSDSGRSYESSRYENMRKSFHKFLETKGIKASSTDFLYEYMMKKDSREYLLWLKNFKNFIQD